MRPANLAVAALLSGCGWLTGPGGGVHREEISVGARKRHYEWKAPSGSTAAPVILAFHGLGGSAEEMRKVTALHDAAIDAGYAIVYGEASVDADRGWSMGCAGCTKGDNLGIDDVAYVDAVLDDLAGRASIDRNRLYVTGFSMGAWFSYALACKRATSVRAIVPVGGLMPRPVAAACAPANPVDVLVIFGDQDATQPYDGKAGPYGLFGADSSASYWADAAQCTGTEANPPVPAGGSRVGVILWNGCADGTRVERHKVGGLPHIWPLGEYSANEQVMRAFARK